MLPIPHNVADVSDVADVADVADVGAQETAAAATHAALSFMLRLEK